MNLPGYKCPLCDDSHCSLVNGTNCQLWQFAKYRRYFKILSTVLLQIEKGEGDPQHIAHKALVDTGVLEPDEFDTTTEDNK